MLRVHALSCDDSLTSMILPSVKLSTCVLCYTALHTVITATALGHVMHVWEHTVLAIRAHA